MRTHRPVRTTVGALAAAAVLALTSCSAGGDDDAKAPDSSGSSDTSSASADPSADASTDASPDAAAEPDLEGIPDVVAEVNGEEVTKDEFVPVYRASFQQAAAQAQMGGEAPDEEALQKQAVDDLVDTELLAQEADSRGISVSDEDVDAELQTLAEQNQMGSAEELLKAVEEQGLSEDQARAQVETQVMVEQLVDDEGGPIEPSEKELRTLYAQAKKQQAQSGQKGQSIPPFAQVRDQIAEQATAEQVGKVAQSLVDDLRKDADITINL
jgi:peptidyl-prolyl cis-trans isomerase SurA